MASADRTSIPGSTRQFSAEHPRVGDVDEQQSATVTVYLRDRGSLGGVVEQGRRPVSEQRRMTHEQWAGAHGASAQDIAAVRAFAAEHGLTVAEASPERRMLRLTGKLAAITDAFGVRDLALFKHPDGRIYRGRQGDLSVPSALAGVIVGVFGIDDRPQAHPHIRKLSEQEAGGRGAAGTTYTPIQVAQAYDFPAGLTGAGETVAIIELGGGYRAEDLSAYFSDLGAPLPSVSEQSVDGAGNSPGGEADGEVMLDIEVVGAVAPGATIVVYFTPNTDAGFIDAVSQAVHDSARAPSAVSISWGGPEDSWTQQAREQMEQVLTEAAALGVTVTVAAGDNGSTDGVQDGHQHVDFPACAPHALACGGTSLSAQGARIAEETVWNDGPGQGATGGGVSIEFALPDYQASAQVPANVDTHASGRGVPDVAGNADPQTGYEIRIDGSMQTIGGTSAVAPLWAGLITLLNQSLGKPVGFLQPQLYGLPSGALNDITTGNNGAYTAGPGWDACTGLGSPNGGALLQALGGGSLGGGSSTAGPGVSRSATPIA
jgi:kumamolisin